MRYQTGNTMGRKAGSGLQIGKSSNPESGRGVYDRVLFTLPGIQRYEYTIHATSFLSQKGENEPVRGEAG